MTDETIQEGLEPRTDVSESEQGQEAQAQAAEAEAQQAAGSGEPVDLPKPELNDPASKRERKMAELAEKRREERERERKAAALMNDPDLTEEEYDSRLKSIQEGADEPGEDEGEDPPETDDQPAAEQPKPAEPDERGWLTREDGTRVKRLVVNGRQVEMTEEQYDRQVQKALAGDERLRQAAEYEQRLRQREQQLNQQAQQSRQQPPSGASSVDFDKALAEYHDALLEGDTDAARQKLGEVFQAGRQSSTPNIEDLVSTVATRVAQTQAQERHRESVQSAWDKFQTEYSDIANDDGLIAYADTQIKRLRAENPNGDPEFIMLEAGRLTREKLGLGKPTQQPSDDRAARMERKANLKPIPKASGARAPSKAEPKVDMSPAAKIARMRASRVAS